MAMLDLVAILITAIVGAILVGVLIFVAIWRAQHNRRQEKPSSSAIGVETIVPTEGQPRKKSNGQLFSPEAVRAQKFRERARTTVIGKPEFRLSQKKFRQDIYKTLENHPNFKDFEEFYREHNKVGRRVSEDRTSYGNSTIDESDMARGNLQRLASFDVERQLYSVDDDVKEDEALPDV